MRVLVDENIPKITVHALSEMEHDVLDIRNTDKQGMDDEKLWLLAQTDTRLLITTDKGFVDHREENHYGILIVHCTNLTRRASMRGFWPHFDKSRTRGLAGVDSCNA